MFFVISGFLITRLISQGMAEGSFSFADFYARRIRRIFPALILVLLACFGFGWVGLFASELEALGRHIAAGAGFVSNFVLWSEVGYFDAAAETKPLLHLWSLALEEQFYLAWPPLLWLAVRVRINLTIANGVVAATSLAICALLVMLDSVGAFYSPLARMWELQLGAALALTPAMALTDMHPHRLRSEAAAMAGLALIAVPLLWAGHDSSMQIVPTLAAAIGTALILATGPETRLHRMLLSHRAMVGIGLVSYPLYLWHWPMLALARIVEGGTITPAIAGAAVSASLVCAVITFTLVERPIRSPRHSTAQRRCIALTLVAVMIGVGMGGWLTGEHHGWPDRLANAAIARNQAFERPGLARTSDGSCARLAMHMPATNEVCVTNSANPEVLLLGDSHAMALYAGIQSGRITQPTLLLGAHGCLPFEHYSSIEPHERLAEKNCPGVARAALATLEKLPSIHTVWLVTRGSLYVTGRGYGIEGNIGMRIVRPDGSAVPSAAQAFLDGYTELVARLLATGKKVVFITDVPELGADPRLCVAARPLSITSRAAPECNLPRATVEARQQSYRVLVDTLARAQPALQVFDSLATFCDATTCRAFNARESYYWDDDHLSVAGSTKLLRAILGEPTIP